MRTYTLLAFTCCFLLGIPRPGWGQTVARDSFPAVWGYVHARLKPPATVEAFDYLDQRVRQVCRQEPGCSYALYDSLVTRLEQVFHLPAAIHAAEQRLEVAEAAGMNEVMTSNFRDLYRFNQALGNYEVSIVNLENAIGAARKSEDKEMLGYLTFAKLEDALQYQDPDVAFAALDSFLRAAEADRDTSMILMANSRLALSRLDHGRPAEAAVHIAALEAHRYPDSLSRRDADYVMTAAAGRGKLAVLAGEPDTALVHFRKALALAREFSRNWWEISVLNTMAEQEAQLGQHDLAWKHLDSAAAMAVSLGLHDLLANNYGVASAIAEQEHDYSRALDFLKQKQAHLIQYNQQSAGFSTRNYYLNREKETLQAARKNQQSQLRLQQIYSRTLLASVIVISILAIGLVVAYRNQRQRRKELLEQNTVISQQAKRLEELDQVKSTFFANVSHELRTPLTLIVGPLSTLLQDSSLNARQRRLLDMIRSSGNRLEALVTDLLRLSKLERDQTRLDLEETELLPFFQEPFTQFAALAQTRKLRFTSEIRVREGTIGEIDREKCRRIIFNLLSNAFKHTPAGGHIHAFVTLAQGQLELFVEDSGTGIHPDDLPHIFDRYWQSSRPEKTPDGGVGIGLSLCQKYVRLLGGDIRAESQVGQGAMFHVRFPLNYVHAESPTSPDPSVLPAPEDLPEPRPNQPTILVAEDNPDLGDYLRLMLQDSYTVVVRQNGRDALDFLRRNPPGTVDLLITDLMMPVLDGFALLEAIHEDPLLGDIPAVVVTARCGDADKLRVLRLGVDDYLLKPFCQEELQVRIQNLLRNRSVRSAHPEAAAGDGPADREDPLLRQIEHFVSEHCGNPALSVLQLAQEFAMSESTLLRKLKSRIGLTPQKYIQEVRLKRARHRLETQDFETLEQLAREVGYSNARNFSRSFVRRFGRTPSSYLPD